MLEIIFFSSEAGNQPVLDWLRSLNSEEKFVIGSDLRTVQIGFPLGMPLCRPLGQGLYEVRSSLPTRKEARILFFQEGNDLVVVHGFFKKTQATPRTEMEKARARRDQFLSRQSRRRIH